MNRRRLLSLRSAAVVLLATLASGCPKPAPAGDPLDTIEARGHRAIEEPPRTDGPPVALVGATVLTAAGERFDAGYVIVRDGRIEAVGDGVPELAPDVHRIDASGHFVTPGIIDTHSHLGVYPTPKIPAHSDGNEATGANTAGVWAEHSVWPQDPGFERALAGGVTTLHILPGSANLIGGRGVTLHLHPTRGSRAMRFPGAPDSVKMACGENPKRVYGERRSAPSTRMGNVRGHRSAFIAARDYLDGLKKGKDLGRDLGKETLALVLMGKLLPQVHCYRADDMLSFLQVADEFDFEVRSFHHALEAYKIADILAKKNVAVSTWADWWGFKAEAWDGIQENAAMVARAGGRAIIHSDSGIGIQRLNQEASKAMTSGRRAGIEVSENDALRWITANPAWALGIDAEVGTIEVGKRADLTIWDKHPFSVYARARWVFVDGVLRWNLDRGTAPWSDFEVGIDR